MGHGLLAERERYKTQDEIVGTMKEFRHRHFPIDNIVQDWSYWPEDAWGSHDFDLARFPNPKQMVDDIHALNGRVMISVWPKFYASTEHYKQFDEKGWMYQQATVDSIKDWIGPGYVALSMMPTPKGRVNFSGSRCKINSILWVLTLGGWMPANLTYATVPICSTVRISADLPH